MLTAYAKLANLYPALRPHVTREMKKLQRHAELELQQRACEYLSLGEQADDFVEDVLREMPAYAADRESALEKRMQERSGKSHDPTATTKAAPKAEAGASNGGARARRARAAAPAGGNLLDMDEPPPPPRAAAPAAPPAPPGAAKGVEEALLPQMKLWFNELVVSQQGTLFENDLIKVSCRHAYQNAQIKLALYVGNKSASGELAAAPDAPIAFVPDVPYLRLTAGPAAPSIAPGAQEVYGWTGECMAPFAEVPEVRLSFVAGGVAYRYPLRLPVVASGFCAPTSFPGGEFLPKWEALAGDDREATVTFAAAGGKLDGAAFAKARDDVIVKGMKMGLCQGAVPGFDERITVHAATTLCTATTPPGGGAPLTVGCLLRLEARPQQAMYRITVRARHGAVAAALKNVLKAQLA